MIYSEFLLFVSLCVAVSLSTPVTNVIINSNGDVKNVGEDFKVLCRVKGPIESCQIGIGNVSYSLKNNDKVISLDETTIRYEGEGFESGECGALITHLTRKQDGQISCQVVQEGEVRAVENNMMLYIASEPEEPVLSLNSSSAYIEGQVAMASCKVAGGRPLATEPILAFKNRTNFDRKKSQDKDAVTAFAQWEISADDDQEVLTCSSSHYSWQGVRYVNETIRVHYQPKVVIEGASALPSGILLISGVELGKTVILARVRSNPIPLGAEWTVGNQTIGTGCSDDSYVTSDMMESNGSYIYTLTVNLTRSSAEDSYSFRVTNPVGSTNVNFSFMVKSGEKEDEEVNHKTRSMAGLETGAIVVAVVVLLVVIAVVVYAKYNKKWCFANRHVYFVKNSEGDLVKMDHQQDTECSMIDEPIVVEHCPKSQLI